MEKKRGDVPEPEPVSHGGIRYEAVPWGGQDRGLENGGYVAAIDESTGREKWVVKVYAAPHDPDMEGDKLDVFVSRLSLGDGGRRLLVENERGKRYAINLADRSVQEL
jgi:hypothetical protein